MSFFEDEDELQAAKVAFVLRMARTALGMNQAEFGELMGVSKPTIVRIETMETPVKLAFYSRMVKALAKKGIEVDVVASDGVKIEADQAAISELIQKMQEEKAQKQRRNKSLKAGAEDNKADLNASNYRDAHEEASIYQARQKAIYGKE